MSEVFDLNYQEPLGRRPINDYPGLEVSRTHSLATLQDCIAWMATCGEVDYREVSIPYVQEAFANAGLPPDALEQYSPMTDEWTPACAITEKRYLAESRFLALPVLSTSDGQASTAEVPFGVIGGLMRGQEIFTHITPGGELGQRVFIGRAVTRAYLEAFRKELAPVKIHNYETMADLHKGVAAAAIQYLQSPAETAPSISPIVLEKPLLFGRMAVTGSGNKKLLHDVAEQVERRSPRLRDIGIVHTTYSLGFDKTPGLGIAREVRSKTNNAVNLVAISKEQLSYGAVNEIGWLVLGSILHDQSVGIYMEQHDSADNSPANRQRHLAMSHISRLLQDFPWLTQRISVEQSPAELAEWGALKLKEHYKWRNAMGV